MTETAAACAIEVSGVRRVYAEPGQPRLRDGLVALADVDLRVGAGEFVSIIGPSGCGKSTLLRLVAGLERPDAGSIRLGGRTPQQAAEAKMLGFVPQTPALLPWLSVLGNVTLPGKINRRANTRGAPDTRRAEMERLLVRAGLGEAMHKRPAEISGGMRQRTAIVRALGLRPDVLLLDEPFSALDEFTRESLQLELLRLWDELGATALFVTHSISEAVRMADRVVVMAPKPGRITDIVEVDLPRPRTPELIASARFHELELRLRELLADAFRAGQEVR
ncbi:MAG: ABC transporter ATP-binding protein [Nocardioides sp.]|uniref:ABC transporter ATP-binding protein n=1 Tax=Nocardioides sp. TaxID=35761 RepID=UPI0039E5B828